MSPFLRSRGIHKVNSLVLSHGDNDHVGGTESILRKFAVDEIVTSEPDLFAQYTGIKAIQIKDIQVKAAEIDDAGIKNTEIKNFKFPPIKTCYLGQHWEWDGVKFEFLHPDTIHTKKQNDHSCVLRVQAGESSHSNYRGY